MGNSNKKYLPADLIQLYQEKYYLSEIEINKLFKTFRDIYKPGNYNHQTISKDYLLMDSFTGNFKQIKANPFRDRLFKIFASDEINGITFEGMLEMMSVFSPNAPFEIKAYYAFKIYDFDDDDYLSKNDLIQMASRILDDDFDSEDLNVEKVVENIIKETDMDEDGKLSLAEFEHAISKAPDFMNTFSMKI